MILVVFTLGYVDPHAERGDEKNVCEHLPRDVDPDSKLRGDGADGDGAGREEDDEGEAGEGGVSGLYHLLVAGMLRRFGLRRPIWHAAA